MLASRSFRPGQRSSIRMAMSRSRNRTTSGVTTWRQASQPPRPIRPSRRPARTARVEVDQPVGQAGHDHQRHQAATTQAQPVEGQEPADPAAKRGDPRFQLTGVH